MKVTFKHSNGREQVMTERFAKILQGLGRGTYQAEGEQVERAFHDTDDLRSIHDVGAEIKAENANLANDLDDLDAEALHALAKERGVKVHHKAGADKVRKALREAV